MGTPSSALAALSEWYTDAAESTDGRYLFVSLSNRPLDVELKDEGLTGEERDQIEFFRLHYPVSGMYLNDGSNTPIWKFDEPWRGEPIIAPDGEHVIFQGRLDFERDRSFKPSNLPAAGNRSVRTSIEISSHRGG